MSIVWSGDYFYIYRLDGGRFGGCYCPVEHGVGVYDFTQDKEEVSRAFLTREPRGKILKRLKEELLIDISRKGRVGSRQLDLWIQQLVRVEINWFSFFKDIDQEFREEMKKKKDNEKKVAEKKAAAKRRMKASGKMYDVLKEAWHIVELATRNEAPEEALQELLREIDAVLDKIEGKVHST